MSNPPADGNSRLATIRALLAKAEATAFPEEAEAFTAKASELMARYAIDEAVVWSNQSVDGRSQPVETRIEIHRPFLGQKALLVNEVATILGCRTVRFVGRRGDASETMSIVGFPTDLELVETLVTSLFLQLTSAMMAGSPPRSSPSSVAAWRRSFIVGFTSSVSTRLAADRATAVARGEADRGIEHTADNDMGASNCTSVVLADRGDAVTDEFQRIHPRTRQVRIGVGSSSAGHDAGSTAGRRADLGARRLRRQRALPG